MGDDHSALKDLDILMRFCPGNNSYRHQHAAISRRCGDWKCAFNDYIIARGLRTFANPPDTNAAESSKMLSQYGPIEHKITRGVAKATSQLESHISLTAFRSSIGQTSNVFEAIFPDPSELHVALSIPPGMRDATHISILTETFARMSSMSTVPRPNLERLAAITEHCLLDDRNSSWINAEKLDACYLVLSGFVGVHLRAQSGIDTLVGHLDVGDFVEPSF